MPAVAPLIVGAVTVYQANKQAHSQQQSQQAQERLARESLAAQEQAAYQAQIAEQTSQDKALKFQTEQRDYDREAQRLAREDYIKRTSPYVDMGNAAFGRLSELLGTSGRPNPIQVGGGSTTPVGVPTASSVGTAATPQGGTRLPAFQAPVSGPAAAGGSLTSLGTAPTGGTADIGQGQPQQTAMGVRMVAPTGEIGIVPYAKVGQAIAAGARRVNG